MNASKVTKTYGQSNTSAKTESVFGTKTQGNGTLLQASYANWRRLRRFDTLSDKTRLNKQNESRTPIRLTTEFCRRTTTSEETKKICYNYAEEMQKKDYICTSADEFGHLLTENIRLAERKQTF